MTPASSQPPAAEIAPESSDSGAKRHVRGSALLLGGRFISLGLHLVTQLLTVRYLSKHDYGAFAFAFTMAALASSLSVFGLDKTGARFAAMFHERREYARLFGTLLLVTALILAVGTAIVLAVIGFRGLIGETIVSNELSLVLLLTMIALAPIQALDSALVSLFAVFAGARAVFFRRHVLAPGLQLAAVALVMAMHGDVRLLAVGYVTAGLLGVVIYALVLVHVLRRQGLFKHFDRQALRVPFREIVGFSAPVFASDLAFLVRGAMAVFFLEFFQHSTAVADFRAVLPVARLNQLVLQSFTFLFIPITARLLAQNNEREITHVHWKSVLWITVFSFPLFAVTFTLAGPVTVVLFGERYADSGSLLAILAVGFYIHAAAGLNSRTLKVYGKLRYVMAIDAMVTLFAAPLYLLLIPRYGAMGAAVSLCLIMVFHTVANQVGLRLATGISPFGRRYLNLYAGVAAIALVLWQVQSLLSPPLYVGLGLAAIASIALLRLNRGQLQVEETFPELLRVPILRRFLSAKQGSSAGGTVSGRKRQPLTDENRLANHLRDNAPSYFHEFDKQRVDVELVRAHHRWSCHLYRFALHASGGRRLVVVKLPQNPREKLAPRQSAADRPRLRPLCESNVKYRFEYAALSAIQRHFEPLNDSRFGTVRMLDLLNDCRAIVMEQVPDLTLRQRLFQQHRLTSRGLPPELKAACRNAGAWLRLYHQLPRMEHTQSRPTRRADFLEGLGQFADYLSHHIGQPRFFRRIEDLAGKAAQNSLPEVLPCGTGHGDFAPRNVFVGPGGRVTVFDTLGRWRVPIYEDLASFLVALKASAACVYSRGLWFHKGIFKDCEDELLGGYFGAGFSADAAAAIRLFELQALLNRWSSLTAGRNSAYGLRSAAKRARLAIETRYFRRYAKRLLREIEAPPR